MEIIQFLLEFTVVTVLIAAAAPLTLTSWFTGRKKAGESIDA
jgi:type II secretory pathway pseudopilin PulG